MQKLIMVIALMTTLVGSIHAQEKVCKLYGAVQAAHLDFYKSLCTKASSEKACSAVYSSLEDVLYMSINSTDEVIEEQTQGCKVIVTHLGDYVFFSVESAKGYYESAKNKVKALYNRLNYCDSFSGLEISDE